MDTTQTTYTYSPNDQEDFDLIVEKIDQLFDAVVVAQDGHKLNSRVVVSSWRAEDTEPPSIILTVNASAAKMMDASHPQYESFRFLKMLGEASERAKGPDDLLP